jgi:glycogen(starch) synthase
MRIAITSRLFFPLKGGVPVIVRLLANAWQKQGHEVRLLTRTPADDSASPAADCPTIRMPSTGDLMAVARWCDVVFQMEVSMRMIWPFVLFRRPCIISHQTHFSDTPQVSLPRRMQGWVAACSHPVSCSQVIRKSWGGHGIVIGNPYEDRVFHLPAEEEPRPHQLLFVGRLVRDKGLDVLLQALVILCSHGRQPHLRVVGDGFDAGASMLPEWRQEVASLGLEDQVTFLGGKDSPEIAEEMRQSQILIVPSTWQEPFGIVALEGLASGCRVVASSGGGLPDAGGPFATYFENGSAGDLVRVLLPLLDAPLPDCEDAALTEHLDRHRACGVAARFVSHFNAALGSLVVAAPLLA